MSEGQTRQKSTKKRSLRVVNEHFEAIFNAVWPSAIVNQRFLNCLPAGRHSLKADGRPLLQGWCE
ncbi:hypothetical protein CXF94_07660 [Halomonas sp. Choline-3u-9]|nr:hypothetical protein CXF94_07660 [Halomonas sp. Choline-3u-9]QGQ71990.1 hypothetical protein FDY98_21550 [Halomonas sp. PA16-9]